jgi:hypothetical protein
MSSRNRGSLVKSAVLALLGLAIAAGPAFAQSAINGIVRDTSGAVLPGVTVEASSDVLIEKVKSTVSDAEGRYQILDLRPGIYALTFSLAGFQTFRRDGLQLPAEFTMSVNADLRVGTIEESVTVTGASPVVDVTTAVHTAVLDREVIDAIPTGRTIQGMGQLVPGINLNLPDTGGARAMQQTYMSTHGMTTANNTVMVDGMMVNGLQGDGAVQSYFNDAMNAEVSYQTSGINADTSAGGVRLNMIPREGGNRFSGDFKMVNRPGAWQGDNLTERHKAAGLQAGNATDRIIDYTFSLGGPIRKDRLWFFTSARYISVNNFIADTYFDDGGQGIDDQYIRSAMARLTWQISPRNKLSAYFDEVDKYRGHDMQSYDDPETAATQWFSPAYSTGSVKWTSTLSSQLLLEAGYSRNLEYYTLSYQDGIEEPRGSAAWFAGASRNELDLNGRKAAATSQSTQSPERHNLQAALTWVTGSHNIKTGWQWTWGDFYHTVDANADLTQQYRSTSTGVRHTVPDTVVIRNTPLARYGERLNYDMGVYVQDSWRATDRLTVNAGIRWEAVNAKVHAATAPAGRFVPERRFEEIENLPDWSDWAPRFSAVYDLFGNGKTAVKYSLNRYNRARTTNIAANYNPLLSQTATLQWRDVNGNDIAEGERGCTGYPRVGCEINFATLSANFGIAALNEYGNYPREWNLESGLEVQHELLTGFSVSGSWYKGFFHNIPITINRSWTLDDYSPYTFYNPLTGAPFTVYARSAAAQARPTRNLDTYDPQRERQYEAFQVEFRARPGRGIQVFGGFTVERQLETNCTSPDDPNFGTTTAAFCDEFGLDIPWKEGFKMSASVPVKWGINVSMALQSNQSPNSTRVMTVTRGSTRYPSTCPAPCPAGEIIMPTAVFGQATGTFNLEPSPATFVERINQLDLKVQKTFRYGRVSIIPTYEVFNVNNSDAIISYQTTNALAAAYLRPNSIMQGTIHGLGLMVRW